MKRNKTLWVWLGESVLVFLSVLGAFWVEDYRHNKQETEDYLSTLINFRNDVNNDVFKFSKSEKLISLKAEVEEFHEILHDDDVYNDDKILERMIEISFGGGHMVDWRSPSPYLRVLTSFSSHLLQDSLHEVIEQYQYIMDQEYSVETRFGDSQKDFYTYLIKNLDLEDPESRRSVSQSPYFRNVSGDWLNYVNARIMQDRFYRAQMIHIRDELDLRLRYHQVDYGLEASR